MCYGKQVLQALEFLASCQEPERNCLVFINWYIIEKIERIRLWFSLYHGTDLLTGERNFVALLVFNHHFLYKLMEYPLSSLLRVHCLVSSLFLRFCLLFGSLSASKPSKTTTVARFCCCHAAIHTKQINQSACCISLTRNKFSLHDRSRKMKNVKHQPKTCNETMLRDKLRVLYVVFSHLKELFI